MELKKVTELWPISVQEAAIPRTPRQKSKRAQRILKILLFGN
jgi:hypothetical protein